jgi:hypothetical protein
MVIEYLTEPSGKRNAEDIIDTSKVKRTPCTRAALFVFWPIIFNYYEASARTNYGINKMKIKI